MPTSPGQKRDDDLHKIIRGLQLVLSRIHSEIFNSRNGFKSSFREKKIPPKPALDRVQNCSDPTIGRSAGRSIQVFG